MTERKSILLGITGGIAAYKMADFVRAFLKRNVRVRVAMTKSAERFVAPLTLETLSGNKVWTSDWSTQEDPLIHLNESKGYDMALIAPCTANFISKLRAGAADDILSTVALALPSPPYIAPSMNPRMYTNEAVQDNLKVLAERGFMIIRPDVGEMACGEEGPGRLPSIERLMAVTETALGLDSDLAGKRVVVSAGPTVEPIDPVRFISNRSSGKMGLAIAAAARDRGASVTLVHGPISIPIPEGIETVPVRRTEEMERELVSRFPSCDILIMAAAVSDFRPSTAYDVKMKKDSADMVIPLSKNSDILEKLGRMKKGQILVGFAAETSNIAVNAREKLLKKNLDMVCANDVGKEGSGFDSDYNDVTFITRSNVEERTGRMSKKDVANVLLGKITSLANESATGSPTGETGS